MAEKVITYDIDGYSAVTSALLDLINQFPLLSGSLISFASLEESRGISMYPGSGAAIQTETEYVTGHVTQEVLYPFTIIYRAGAPSEARKRSIKEWLDDLGRWLEKQPVSLDGEPYKIDEYPPITGERKFENIRRATPGYLNTVYDNGVEDWVIQLSARYRNEFIRS